MSVRSVKPRQPRKPAAERASLRPVQAEVGGTINYNREGKFDLQLSQALIDERRLGDVFANAKIEKIELKSETWQWEQTGNICIEFRQNGKPSGIAITQADFWVHELRRADATLLYLMIPIERLKELARAAIKAGNWRSHAGDGGRFDVALIRLRDLLQ